MSKPRIHILALGGTSATRPDATGAMQMGLGADDLVAAVVLGQFDGVSGKRTGYCLRVRKGMTAQMQTATPVSLR